MAPESLIAALTADYSDDELDAIAELFDRSRLLARRGPAERDERLRRAVADAALRALVARRALVLDGTPAHPRVRFLEPHATLLDPFLGADATIRIGVERPGRAETRVLFLRDDRAVEQAALPGQAIQRMTVRAREAAAAVALAGVELGVDASGERDAVELSARTWAGACAAVARGQEPPGHLPAAVLDLLHARTSTTELSILRRESDGVVVHEQLAWLASGELGPWSIVPDPGEQPVTVTLVPRAAAALRAEVDQALAAASAPPD